MRSEKRACFYIDFIDDTKQNKKSDNMKKTAFILGIFLLSLTHFSHLFGQQTGLQIFVQTGVGFDTYLGRNPNNYTAAVSENTFEVNIRNPLHAGLKVGYQFKKIGIHTGISAFNRTFRIDYTDSEVRQRADVKYNVYSIPLDVSFRQTLSEKWCFHVGLGVSADWSGSDDDFRFGLAPPEAEDDNRWYLFNARNAEVPDRMLLVTDNGFNVLSFKPFGGVNYRLNDNFSLLFNATYRLGLERDTYVSTVSVWGYNAEQNVRLGGYSPRGLDLETLHFDVGFVYTL